MLKTTRLQILLESMTTLWLWATLVSVLRLVVLSIVFEGPRGEPIRTTCACGATVVWI